MRTLIFFLSITLLISFGSCEDKDLIPPNPPILSSPTNNAPDVDFEVTFIWEETDLAEGYSFQLSLESDFSSLVYNEEELEMPTITIPNLIPATLYFWRVKAYNSNGNSTWSSTFKLTTKSLGSPALLMPVDNAVESTEIQFSWNEVTDATSYTLQVSTTIDFTSLLLIKSGLTTTSTTIGDLNYSTNYYWRVGTSRPNSSIVWSATRKVTIQPLGIPIQSSPLDGFVTLSKTINLSWLPVSGADFYNLQVSTIADFSSLTHNKSQLSSTSVTINSSQWDKIYYWRVSALVDNCQSEWSEVRTFSPKLPKEGLIAWFPLNGDAIDASGNNHTGVINGGVSLVSNRYNKANSAFLFNGTTGYIEITSLNNLPYKPITYSFWVNVPSYFPSSAGHKFKSIIGRQFTGCQFCGTIGLFADQNILSGSKDNTFLYWMGQASTPDIPNNALVPQLNTWIHLVFTQTANGNFQFFTNGILTHSGNLSNIQNENIAFRIGASGTGSPIYLWDGRIDDVRIYSRVITNDEIAALYNE